ncbi:dynein regulatory complex subunit 5-like [Pectinophora gossypiella]|uniref:dynein regulatory complex subunit 5-like n=1 Tax=Pectinophora gossypiella TaxID=13191 RepID=UPI00214F016B|nr:dynein regulatory complex subunit 5-like [Pectinophora gossypiella]
MKIPYVVSLNARAAYDCSPVMKTSSTEANRLLIAEDFEWDDGVTPAPLTYFAALTLSKIFRRLNPLHKILQKDVDMLMDLFPAEIPLKFSVPHIKDERYWQRSFEKKFPRKKILGEQYWKGKYLSARLQDYLETANPDVFISKDAAALAKLVAPYIYELRLNELQMVRQPTPAVRTEHLIEDTCPFSVEKVYDHIPLEPVLCRLYKLEEISIVFGINDLQERYLPRYFEFSMADIESLCKGLEHLMNLKTVRINRSNMDCSKVKLLLQNLIKKDTLEELDFNHCKIGDYGMKALGGFIYLHNNIKRVRIANNRFKEVGVQGIAYALQMKPAAPIELLDFSLNPMSLECATMFAAAFVRCKEKPQTLIVNSCGFHGASAEKMAGLLTLNRGLTRLDMASNDMSGPAEETLIKALERNRNILKIDLRRTQISDETQARVDELLKRNFEMIGVEREPSAEIPPLYLNEPEYLIWQYNPNNPDFIPGRYPERVPEV